MAARLEIKPKVKTPAETREACYQIWVYECSRNFRLAAKAIGCHRDTLERWAKRHHWQDRARNELGQIMPDTVFQTAINLRMGAWHASQKLERMARLANLEDEHFDYKVAEGLLKLVDRGGFSPVGQSKLDVAPPAGQPPQVSDTVTDLMERHHSRITGE